MNTLYGISNCDSVKKARAWLAAQGIDYQFIDYKKQAPNAALLQTWLKQTPLDALLNTRGTTWRKLSPAEQAQAATESGAIELMLNNPSLIKRPVLEHQGKILLGFDAAAYAKLFNA